MIFFVALSALQIIKINDNGVHTIEKKSIISFNGG